MSNLNELPRIYFWTSGEPPLFLTSLLKSLANHGMDVESRYLISAQEYRKARSNFLRFLLRTRMYLLYPIKIILDCLFISEPCIHIVTSNTFYATLITNTLARKNQRVIHLIWDLFPDALVVAGAVKEGSFQEKAISSIVSKIIKLSDANIFIGKQLLNFATKRYGLIPNAYVIPVGADAEVFEGNFPKENKRKIKISYCGNIGRMHDIDTFLDLMETIDSPIKIPKKIEFHFNCSGQKVNTLINRVANFNKCIVDKIHIGSDLADSDWIIQMKSAEVGLVTMSNGAEKVLFPSKVFSSMVAGQAIIAICPSGSDLSQLVIENDCGWVISPGDTNELLMVLNQLEAAPEILLRKRINSYRAGQEKYSSKVLAAEWVKVFHEVIKN